MNIQVMDNPKKKKFIATVSDFGIKKINGTLVRSGKDKVRVFTGDISREEIYDLLHTLPVEVVGLYLGKDFINRNGVHEVRLSVDGLLMLKDQVVNKILYLDSEQEKVWFLGEEQDLNEEQKIEFKEGGFAVVKSKDSDDILGMGKVSSEGVLFNYLPKERRRRRAMA
jgi:NOL1/NOP2/fmu family ribosome biogenesis protein